MRYREDYVAERMTGIRYQAQIKLCDGFRDGDAIPGVIYSTKAIA
jgi:hypothetical protein